MATEKKPSEALSLRVAESLPKDVGRGLARIDPEDLKTLAAEVGDIVQIEGKRRTVAKIMPAYMDARGKGLIQMDGLLRSNAQVGIDERVKVQEVPVKPAVKIILSPLSQMHPDEEERHTRYIARLIEGLPVLAGDKIRVNLFGSRFQEFLVEEAAPSGALLVKSSTVLLIRSAKGAGAAASTISYEDIGGLGREIQRVREMIELPLRYPEIFERLGIDAPKGVLLQGPPGCGKTLIARAVANETDCHFYSVSGPEVIHKFYGESEAKLRKIFEEAEKNAPSIIFLDEIDAIAPKRESVPGEVEKRVVAQLLALMDGLRSRGQVIVIGATNIANALDPALRRPGRFDREIVIPVPDKKGRREILEVHTRGMPLADDVSIENLVDTTHGFSGADLEALCREAAMAALRGILPQFEGNAIPYETLMELRITKQHFYEALKEVEPSALREISVEVPNVRWDDVGGLKTVKKQLQEAVEWPLKYAALFAHAKTRPPKGILLYGPPGTGKTLLAKAAATQSQANFISIKGPALLSKWVGEAERGVREIFKKAKQAAPAIIFFDEIDAVAPRRDQGDGSGVSERLLSQLLTEMDGIEELRGVIVLGATNRLDRMDPALLRPGRFDFLIELPFPDEESRSAIFEVHAHDMPLAEDVDLSILAKEAEGFSGADIESICQRAALLAIREYVEKHAGQEKKTSFPDFLVNMKHFNQAKILLRGTAICGGKS